MDERFDRLLEEKLDDATGAELLAIPGLYEVVAEHYNNEILRRIEEDASEPDGG